MYLKQQAEIQYPCIWRLNNNRHMDTIAKRISRTRKERGITQTELARRVGVSQGTIGHIEAGRNDTSKYLGKISSALGVRAEWLEFGRGETTSEWPFPGVSPEDYACLPTEEKDEIIMIVKAKVARYSRGSSGKAA